MGHKSRQGLSQHFHLLAEDPALPGHFPPRLWLRRSCVFSRVAVMARRVPLFVGYSNFGATPPRLVWGSPGSCHPWTGVWVLCARPGTCAPVCRHVCKGWSSFCECWRCSPASWVWAGRCQRAEQEPGWDSERAAGVEKYWAVPAVCRVPVATRVPLKWAPPRPRRGWGSSPPSCNCARSCVPE